MKKLLFIFSLLLIFLVTKAQVDSFPVVTPQGSAKTLINNPGSVRTHLINFTFTDTAQANLLSYFKWYDGAQIVTTSGGAKFWVRLTNTWVQTGGSGSAGWLLGGNNLTNSALEAFGSKNHFDVNFESNNLKRFSLNKDGILPQASTAVGIGVDSLTGYLTYVYTLNIGDTLFTTQTPMHFLYDTISHHYTLFIDTADATHDGQLTATNFNVFNGSYSSGTVLNDSTLRLFKNNGGSSDFVIRGVGGGGSGSQTPWLQNINGANYGLDSVKFLNVGVSGGIITENLMPNSQDLTNATYWGASDITVTDNAALDVNGAMTMTELNITNSTGNVIRTTNGQPVVVIPGQTIYLSMDILRGTLSSGVYCVRDVDNGVDIIFTTLTIPAGLASRFTSPSFVVPAGCTHIYIYPARDVASTGTYYVGRIQVHHGTNAYIQTTAGPSPASGGGGYLIAISTDSINTNIGLHGAPDATFNTTEYGSLQALGDSVYMPNLPTAPGVYSLRVGSDGKLTKSDTTGTPTLQQVTNIGNTTTNDLILTDGTDVLVQMINDGGEGRVSVFDAAHNEVAALIPSGDVQISNGVSWPKPLGDAILLQDNITGSHTIRWHLRDIATGDYDIAIRATDSTGSPTNMIYQGVDGFFHKTAVPTVATAVPLSGITAAVGTNSINNGLYRQAWSWDGLSSSYGLSLLSSSVDINSGSTGALVQMELFGANNTSSRTSRTALIKNQNTGTTSTNIAAQFEAISGTNNYAIIVPASSGTVGLGTSAPTAKLHIGAGSATAGTAPLKFTTGTVMTTPEAGALEYNSGLLMLDSSNSVRDTIATRSWARNNISGGGGGTPSLTAKYIAYGDGSNLLTGTSGLQYDASIATVTIEGANPSLLIHSTSGDPGGIIQRGSQSSTYFMNSSNELAFNGYNGINLTQTGVSSGVYLRYSTGFKASLGIGTTTPDASASLDVSSTTAGFLPPRMTTTQKNAISSPALGLIVYDLTLNKLCVFTGSWETVTSL